MTNTHCGYVAILGRPNVGKSTLLNHLLAQKISIVSAKPQTTRHRILGIKTENNYQIVYVDTPGVHQNTHHALNRYMNRAALAVIHDVNVIIFMVEALKWQADDEWILNRLKEIGQPVILAINKVDLVSDKSKLLPFIQKLADQFKFETIIPLSAADGDNVQQLEDVVKKYLPAASFLFPDDQITDRSERFLAAEIIREKLFQVLQQEVPYGIAVEIEHFEEKEKLTHIAAIIWIDKPGQKAIVIGTKGSLLKKVGTQAREELEKLLERKVFLQLWIKVKSNWADDERALKSLGYQDGE